MTITNHGNTVPPAIAPAATPEPEQTCPECRHVMSIHKPGVECDIPQKRPAAHTGEEADGIVRTLGRELSDALTAGESARPALRAIYLGKAGPQDWEALREYLDTLDRHALALGRPLT